MSPSRGGKYKNGAIVLHLDALILILTSLLPPQRTTTLGQTMCQHHTDWWEEMDVITRQKLIKGIKAGDIWLKS